MNGQNDKESTWQMQETGEMQVQSRGQKCSLEGEMATHSSILVWKIPWTEEPGGLQSIWSQRVRHHWAQHAMNEWTWVFIKLLTSQKRDIDMMGLLVKEHSLPKNPNLKIKSRSYLDLISNEETLFVTFGCNWTLPPLFYCDILAIHSVVPQTLINLTIA